jgi:hypothetical protein
MGEDIRLNGGRAWLVTHPRSRSSGRTDSEVIQAPQGVELMRRLVALLSALVLVVAAAGSSVASTTSAKNSFVGDFDLVDPATGLVAGHVVAQFTSPTEKHVSPGTFQFTGASGYPIKAMSVGLADALFWIDSNGGLPHAMVQGAGCEISNPTEYTCHDKWAAMFREFPGEPNSIIFSTCWTGPYPWDWDMDVSGGCAFILYLGKGDWALKVAPE